MNARGNARVNASGNNKPKSWKNKFTGIFKSNPKPRQNNGIEMQRQNNSQQNSRLESPPKPESTGIFSKCSIL